MDGFNDDLNEVLKYGHTEDDFHRKILENTREQTPVLVYADWLEEQGKPALANMLRTGLEDVTGVMHYDYKGATNGVSGPHSVFYYRSIDGGSGVIAFNSEHIPQKQAEDLVKSLLAEGHPAGNNSAKRFAPPK